MTNSHLFSRVHLTTAYVLDQEEALAFYCGTLGFEVASDVDLGFMRWLTISLPSQPEHEVLLEVPGAPQHDEETAAQLRDLMTKGALGATMFLHTDDCQKTFETLRDAEVEITQEPVDQPYGIDIGVRDPFGNHIRITQPHTAPREITEDVRQRWEAGVDR
ncbi:VOC family protein [Nocardioides coralli]|uniref:VOC family protein n=1 Tax=Nocardioides coralli TaxID=2872154 RepID=UPI001CA38F63|nr:VOC family protein [Nocardioides coralli]QZY29014.1 VOC family protein [Nocardioides coralli]